MRAIETSTSFNDLLKLVESAVKASGLQLFYLDSDGDEIELGSQDGAPLSCFVFVVIWFSVIE